MKLLESNYINLVEIFANLVTLAIVLGSAIALKPVLNWILLQLYKLFIGSDNFR